MNETFVRLSEEQINLIIFALEQQEYDFNATEISLSSSTNPSRPNLFTSICSGSVNAEGLNDCH